MSDEKIKCWVTYCSEFPGGMVWQRREDALDYTREMREDYGEKAYCRVKYFTEQELDELSEAD